MSQKAYTSNICTKWPIVGQDAAINKYIGNEPITVVMYSDTVHPYGRKPEFLKERANMLRPTARNGHSTIVVHSLACLAFDPDDLANVLTLAGDRGAEIRDLHAGITIKPNGSGAEWRKAMKAFTDARAGMQESQRGHIGGTASGEKRHAEGKAGCDRIAAKWGNPKYETPALLKEAGCCYGTAIKHLGKRPIAITNFLAAQKRKAKKAKAA